MTHPSAEQRLSSEDLLDRTKAFVIAMHELCIAHGFEMTVENAGDGTAFVNLAHEFPRPGFRGEVYSVNRSDRNCSLDAPRYLLARDNSGHEYAVPCSRLADWNKWCALSEDDPEGWEAPDWAYRIEGGFTFTDPKETP